MLAHAHTCSDTELLTRGRRGSQLWAAASGPEVHLSSETLPSREVGYDPPRLSTGLEMELGDGSWETMWSVLDRLVFLCFCNRFIEL